MNPLTLDRVSVLLNCLWRASWQAAILAGIVFAAQLILAERLPARWRFNLWMLVVLRLIVLVVPSSPVSVFNYVPDSKAPAKLAAAMPELHEPAVLAHPLSPALPQKVTAGTVSSTEICWPCVMFAIWGLGAGLLLLRIAWAWARLRKDIAQCRIITDEKILAIRDECVGRLEIRRTPALLIADHFSTPALTGIWQPKILLPVDVVQRFDARELRLILLHELTHLRRNDVAINWIMAIAQSAHWFNPVIWLAMARCRVDREIACDEAVLAIHGGGESAAYGATILKLIESAARGAVLPGVVGILERPHALRRRVTMIANFATRKKTWPVAAAVAMLAIAIAGLTDAVHGQQNPQKPAAALPAVTEKHPTKTLDVTATNGPLTLNTNTVTINGAPSADDHARDILMAKVLPEVRFDNVPLSDVVDFLRDAVGVNIFVNWQSLESAGIEKNMPISLNLKEVRLSKILDLIGQQMQANGAGVQFDYADRVLTLATTDPGKQNTTRAVYAIDDLIAGVVKKAETTQPEIIDQERRDAAQRLVKLIESHVSPDTWTDNGGTLSQISEFNGKIVVTTSAANHQEIKQLLADLRQSSAASNDKPQGPQAAVVKQGDVMTAVMIPEGVPENLKDLWLKVCAKEAVVVNGQIVNPNDVDEAFKKEVRKRSAAAAAK